MRLSARVRRALGGASASSPTLASAASVLEIATLVRRGRLSLSTSLSQWIGDVRRLPEIRFVPVSVEVAACAGGLGDDLPADPMDRLIVATAILTGSVLVSADRRLRKMPDLRVVW